MSARHDSNFALRDCVMATITQSLVRASQVRDTEVSRRQTGRTSATIPPIEEPNDEHDAETMERKALIVGAEVSGEAAEGLIGAAELASVAEDGLNYGVFAFAGESRGGDIEDDPREMLAELKRLRISHLPVMDSDTANAQHIENDFTRHVEAQMARLMRAALEDERQHQASTEHLYRLIMSNIAADAEELEIRQFFKLERANM